jgi:hypothetical protein
MYSLFFARVMRRRRPALLLQVRRILLDGPGMRDEMGLDARQEDDVELEPLAA